MKKLPKKVVEVELTQTQQKAVEDAAYWLGTAVQSLNNRPHSFKQRRTEVENALRSVCDYLRIKVLK